MPLVGCQRLRGRLHLRRRGGGMPTTCPKQLQMLSLMK